MLRTQLAAIATAARDTDADVWVMAPMVADAGRGGVVRRSRRRRTGSRTAGVMVEVPSAAMLADQIFEVAAFASIGTNDLAQYALAVDRQIGRARVAAGPVASRAAAAGRSVGRAGRAAGRPVGVCGEAAADPVLARVLVGLGVTSLSMAPPALADVRASLAEVTVAECQAAAARAVTARSAAEARARVGAAQRRSSRLMSPNSCHR